jgi:hypothetical protein
MRVLQTDTPDNSRQPHGRGSDLKQEETQKTCLEGANTLPTLFAEGVLKAYLNQSCCLFNQTCDI